LIFMLMLMIKTQSNSSECPSYEDKICYGNGLCQFDIFTNTSSCICIHPYHGSDCSYCNDLLNPKDCRGCVCKSTVLFFLNMLSIVILLSVVVSTVIIFICSYTKKIKKKITIDIDEQIYEKIN